MPRTRKQNKAIRNKRKEQILNSALKVFCYYHVSDVSVSRIAREAGCGHSLIYHYFKNVNEIAIEAIHYIHEYIDNLLKFTENPTINPTIKFIGGISYFVDMVKADYKYAFYLHALFKLNKFVPEKENPYSQTNLRNRMHTLILETQKEGKVIDADPRLIVDLVYLYIRGIISDIITEETNSHLRFTASAIYLPLLVKSN